MLHGYWNFVNLDIHDILVTMLDTSCCSVLEETRWRQGWHRLGYTRKIFKIRFTLEQIREHTTQQHRSDRRQAVLRVGLRSAKDKNLLNLGVSQDISHCIHIPARPVWTAAIPASNYFIAASFQLDLRNGFRRAEMTVFWRQFWPTVEVGRSFDGRSVPSGRDGLSRWPGSRLAGKRFHVVGHWARPPRV